MDEITSAQSEQNNTVLENISEKATGFLEGINESKSIAQKQLSYVSNMSVDVGPKGWFAETLNKILEINETESSKDDENRQLSESIKETLSDMKLLDETNDKISKEGKNKKANVSQSAKFDDLKSIPFELATLGAVLHNAITGGDKNNKKNEGKGLSGFFKGLMEGVSGITSLSVALLAFAGATVLFNFVDWGKALIGLLSFTAFTIGMVAIAKRVGDKDTLESFISMSKASFFMSAALGAFAIGLFLVSSVVSGEGMKLGPLTIPPFDVDDAIIGIGLFLVFEIGLVVVAKLLNGVNSDMINFAKGSMLMAGALVAFSLAIFVVSNLFGKGINLGIIGKALGWGEGQITVDPAMAALGVATFLAFELAIAGIARLAGQNISQMIKFATASLMMTSALVVFSLSLVVVSSLFTKGLDIGDLHLPKVEIGWALAGVGIFLAFIGVVTLLTAAAQPLLGPMAIFGAVSILMSTSLALFGIAMAISGIAAAGGNAELGGLGKFSIPENNGINAIKSIAAMAAFMIAFAGLGALLLNPILPTTIAIASVTITGIALATMAFGKALAIAGGVINGGEFEIEGKSYKLPKYNAEDVDKMFTVMTSFIENFSDTAKKINIFGAITTAIVAKSVMPLIDTMDKMLNVVIKAGENQKYILKMVNNDSNALDHLMDPVLYVILGHDLSGSGGLMYVANHMSKYSAKVLKLVAESLVPITDSMLNMIEVVIKAAENKKLILDVVNSDENAIDHLMDPVMFLILGHKLDGSGGLMSVAMTMGKYGAETLQIVSQSMLPLVESMDKMIDVVLKAANMNADGKTVDQLVEIAMTNLNLIMLDDGVKSGFLPMFVNTANELRFTSKSAAEAIKVMPTMVQALGDMVDIVAKSGELDKNKVNNGILNLKAMSNFFVKFVETINEIIPGGMGGIVTRIFGGNPLKKIEEAHEYLQPGGAFYNVMKDMSEIAKTFDGAGFENLGKISVIGSFTIDMLSSSANFKDIMGNIQKGIDKFKTTDKLVLVTSALEKLAAVPDITSKFDPLHKLIERSVELRTAADDIERIAAAYSKISQAEKIGDIGGPIQQKGALSVPEYRSQSTSSNINTASQEFSLNGQRSIEDILNDWYSNGVRVKPYNEVKQGKEIEDLLSV